MITGSHAVIKSLIEEGIKVIFGYPGGQIIPIYDALYDYKEEINHVLVRHEQGAVHAAEGYARATGRVGVCFATSGPGATNLVTGIADAMIDSVPVLCITGQVGSNLLGSDAFQEVDMIGITTPITKWNYQITDAAEIPQIIAKAIYIARTGRPGPVVIDIARNAQISNLDFSYKKCSFIESYQPNYSPNLRQIKSAAELINKAKRPLVLSGHGVIISQAQNELLTLIEKASLPTAFTLLGLSTFPSRHPLNMGMLGMHGNYGPNILTNKADVILAIGMRFDDRVTGRLANYAKQARIIHIDIDPAELNKNVRADIPLVADAKIALKALIPLIEKKSRSNWLTEFNKYQKIEKERVIHKEIHPKGNYITMAEVINLLSEKTSGKAVIVADVGQHQMITARYYQSEKTNNFITSGGLGTMGYALPAAIGAQIGTPKNQVIAIIGDGSFQMNIQELATIIQEKIPLKIIILKNNYLGMVRQWQELFYKKRYSFTDLYSPDFVALAKSYTLKAKKIIKRSQLNSCLSDFLKSKRPYLLEINVKNKHNVFPMIPLGASVDEIRLE